MLNRMSLIAGACALLLSGSAMADTLAGALVWKNKDGAISVKKGSIEFDQHDVAALKLKLEGLQARVAEKAKVLKFETENRTVILAAFRDVGDLPEDTAVIVKASVIEGTNGKVAFGAIYTRSCEKGYADQLSDIDSAMDRLMFAIRERKGCEMAYRGGLLLSHTKGEVSQEQAQEGEQSQEGEQGQEGEQH